MRGDNLWTFAKLLRETGAVMHARRVLRQIVHENPDDRSAWATLAKDLAGSGEVSAALKLLGDARARFGDEPGLLALERQISAFAGSK